MHFIPSAIRDKFINPYKETVNHLIDDTIVILRQALIPNSREDSLRSAHESDYSKKYLKVS